MPCPGGEYTDSPTSCTPKAAAACVGTGMAYYTGDAANTASDDSFCRPVTHCNNRQVPHSTLEADGTCTSCVEGVTGDYCQCEAKAASKAWECLTVANSVCAGKDGTAGPAPHVDGTGTGLPGNASAAADPKPMSTLEDCRSYADTLTSGASGAKNTRQPRPYYPPTQPGDAGATSLAPVAVRYVFAGARAPTGCEDLGPTAECAAQVALGYCTGTGTATVVVDSAPVAVRVACKASCQLCNTSPYTPPLGCVIETGAGNRGVGNGQSLKP